MNVPTKLYKHHTLIGHRNHVDRARQLAIIGMSLLADHVTDPEISRKDKLEALQPYLTRLMPQKISIDGADSASFTEILIGLKALAALENSGD